MSRVSFQLYQWYKFKEMEMNLFKSSVSSQVATLFTTCDDLVTLCIFIRITYCKVCNAN